MSHNDRRTFLRQLIATEAARRHPGTFELYVNKAPRPATMRQSRADTSAVPVLPPVVKKDVSTLPSTFDSDSTVAPHKASHSFRRVKVDANDLPDSLLLSFPHLKHRNVIYHHGAPPLPAIILDWGASAKVDSRRSKADCPSPRESTPAQPRRFQPHPPKPLPPASPPAAETQQQLAASSFSPKRSASYRRQLSKLIEELFVYESTKRKSIVRQFEAEELKLLRLYEDIRQQAAEGRHHANSRQAARNLARSLCIDAVMSAYHVKAVQDSEEVGRSSILFQESRIRRHHIVNSFRRIGLMIPEQAERRSIMSLQASQRSALRAAMLEAQESAARLAIQRSARNTFDLALQALDCRRRHDVTLRREECMRVDIVVDEGLERFALAFQFAFAALSHEELCQRVALRTAFTESARDIEHRTASATKIQALHRGGQGRKEAQRRRSESVSVGVAEATYHSVLSTVATKRALVTQAMRESVPRMVRTPPTKKPSSLEVVVWSSTHELESLFLEIATTTAETASQAPLLRKYADAKQKFVEQLRQFQGDGTARKSDPDLSLRLTERCRRLVGLLLREPETDPINLQLLAALDGVPELSLATVIVGDDLLADCISDGSCKFFDALLGCRGVALPPAQAVLCIRAALGSPVKRILFAGTVLRREQSLHLGDLKDELRDAWQEFFCLACVKPAHPEAEDGHGLRVPLLLLIGAHSWIDVDLSAPHRGSASSPSVYSMLCSEGEIDLVRGLAASQRDRRYLIEASGRDSLSPLAHACKAGQLDVVRFLLTQDDVRQDERLQHCALNVLEATADPSEQQQTALRLVREHTM